jgi:GNAT superfamily N-acetyltransferase
MRVRPATESDHPRMVAVLAAAFADDPPLSWLLPDARRREPLLRRFFAAMLPVYAANGATWVCEEPFGTALWVAPGCFPLPLRTQLAVLPTALQVFGRHPRRSVGGLLAIDRHHPHEPHWYLDYIAVDPDSRSRGAGSALLAPMLARCDTERKPAYLNAGSPRSRDLYARHGFRTLSEFRLPFGGPSLWRMWRYASTSSPASES